MNRLQTRFGLAAPVAAALVFVEIPALAYGWQAHFDMPQTATVAMQELGQGRITVDAPIGADPQLWAAYLEAVAAAPALLRQLDSGLDPDAFHFWRQACIPTCLDDMQQIGHVPIGQLHYLPEPVDVDCRMTPVDASNEYLRLATTLGWHSAHVDEHTEDSVLWYRPVNAAGLDLATGALSVAWEAGVSGAVLPFVIVYSCLWEGDCSFDDADDLASRYNPVTELENLTPGFGREESQDYVGLWHMLHVSARNSEYNDIRGNYYLFAGPEEVPSVVDTVILAYAGTTGLTLYASEATGDNRYEIPSGRDRTDPEWQEYNIGLTEFSPLDNLAQYGWERYKDDPTIADGLGWPLHAIGDAAAPHHAAATTGWGHVPYEDVGDLLVPSLLPSEPEADDLEQLARIIRNGFRWWREFGHSGDGSNSALRAMITTLAFETYDYALDGIENEIGWAYSDRASILYHTELLREDAYDVYRPFEDRYQFLLEKGTSATVAFLAVAAQYATARTEPISTQCPAGEYYNVHVPGCAPMPNASGFYCEQAWEPAPVLIIPASPIDGGGGSGGTGGSGGSGGTEPECLPPGTQNCGVIPCCAPSVCVSIGSAPSECSEVEPPSGGGTGGTVDCGSLPSCTTTEDCPSVSVCNPNTGCCYIPDIG